MSARADAGFSLVETLVAIAVIAVMATLLFQTIATTARLSHQAQQRRAAVLLAQSLLDQSVAASGRALAAGSGRSQGLAWTVRTRAAPDNAGDSGPRLDEVRIDVADEASGRSLARVRTLRLGTAR